jgi:predicted RNase H-like HicB family nuclease
MRGKKREPFKYRILVHYSREDAGYIAVVPELRGCSAWGETEVEALQSVEQAAAAWLESAKANDIEIPAPVDEQRVSGKYALRLPPDLYKELLFEAKTQGTSLNRLMVYKLSKAM